MGQKPFQEISPLLPMCSNAAAGKFHDNTAEGSIPYSMQAEKFQK